MQQRVKELYDQHLSPRKVKEILASEGQPLSDRTLLAFRKRLGIKLRTDDPVVRKQQEDEIRELLTKEYEKGTIQGLGRKLLQNFLQERGIFYPRYVGFLWSQTNEKPEFNSFCSERLFTVYGELKPGGQGPIGFHPKESGRAGASAGGHNAKAALKKIRGEKKGVTYILHVRFVLVDAKLPQLLVMLPALQLPRPASPHRHRHLPSSLKRQMVEREIHE